MSPVPPAMSSTTSPGRTFSLAAVASFQGMAPFARGQKPKIEQACMRPCAPDAMPVLGLVPGTANVVCAYGHNCWGILWAPASGKALADYDNTAGAKPISR